MIEKIFRLIYNIIRLLFIKIRCGSKAKLFYIQPMLISSTLIVESGVKNIIIGKNFKLAEYSKIKVRKGASLIVGNNCFFNCNFYMTVRGQIIIGDNCKFGPNVLIFDHDYDFKNKGGIQSKKMKIGSIKIGNNVWIGSGSIILNGSEIGDNVVVGAGSVIKGKIPSNNLLIQKRNNELIQYI